MPAASLDAHVPVSNPEYTIAGNLELCELHSEATLDVRPEQVAKESIYFEKNASIYGDKKPSKLEKAPPYAFAEIRPNEWQSGTDFNAVLVCESEKFERYAREKGQKAEMHASKRTKKAQNHTFKVREIKRCDRRDARQPH